MNMWKIAVVLLASGLQAQEGQQPAKPEWPCVEGRAVDPSYVELSESTGGQLFMFQKGEARHAAPVMGAGYSHPSTVLRAVGRLSGTREFDVPVDSTMETVLVLASMQCRSAIDVFRPNGAEMTAANSTEFVDLATGRILRADNPEPGKWRVRLSGRGLFVLSVMARTEVRLSEVKFLDDAGEFLGGPRLGVRQMLKADVRGDVTSLKFQLAAPDGEPVADADESGQELWVTPAVERFRIVLTGRDAAGWPVRRVHPVLFRAEKPK